MSINFNTLQSLLPQKSGIIAQLPSSGGSEEDGMGDLFSGISGLMGAFKGNNSGSGQSVDSPQGPTGSYVQNAVGMNPQGNQTNSKLEQTISHDSGIFGTAQQLLGKSEFDPIMKSYLQKANPNLDPSKTPWCAGFVGSVLNANGIKGTGSLSAKSYLKYGNPTNNPQRGDIVVFNDMSGNNNPERGHIGFVDRIENGQVFTLGGNQNNSVSLKSYPINAVAGFRQVPTANQVQQFANQNQIKSPKELSNIPRQAEMSNEIPFIKDGIAHVESSGSKDPYTLKSKPSRNGDRAYGKYQIMGSNIPSWSKEALGYPITKDQFLASPELQEKIAEYHMKKAYDKYGNADDVYSTWFSGRPVNKAGNAKDAYGTSVPQYIKKARQGYLKSRESKISPTSQNEVVSPNESPIKQLASNNKMPYPPATTPNIPAFDPRTPIRDLSPKEIEAVMKNLHGSNINWGLLQLMNNQATV